MGSIEKELMDKICKDVGFSVKEFKKFLNTSRDLSYQHNSQSARNKEYLDLIEFFTKGE